MPKEDEYTKEILDEEEIKGHEGDPYETVLKEFEGYDLKEEPENKTGEMTADTTYVIYKYIRPAKVIAKYVDEDEKEIAKEETQSGQEGDEYKTEEKEIEYYVLEKQPENKEGIMNIEILEKPDGTKEIKDVIEVIYRYRKLKFDLKVEKKIGSIFINGEEKVINGDLGKVEVHRKELLSAKVQVSYKIKVTNVGELQGRATIQENIPTGMTMKEANNKEWKVGTMIATIETDEIKPNKSKEYEVIMDWENGENTVGQKENIAEILNTQNAAGFKDIDPTNNKDSATIFVAIGTGETTYIAITAGLVIILLAAGVVIWKKRK